MRMEASKCPKCGEEPNFLEHMEKWYCYECNSYVDDPEAEEEAIEAEATSEPTVQEAVEGESSPAKEAKAPTEVKMCPNCGQPLKWIEKYQRDYCYSCKKYAPVRKTATPKPEAKPDSVAAGKSESVKVCPECSGEMKYIEKYTEWYCHACRKYPLHKSKPKAAAEAPKADPKCPKCDGAVRYIEKYQRHYCDACKEYAPKGAVKTCPACKSELKYIKQYNEWYCYKCKKYPLRPSKPLLLL